MVITSIRSLAIPDVKIVRFGRFHDARGYFCESLRFEDVTRHPDAGALAHASFTQANESYSRAGTMRGLHMQWQPNVAKLIRTVHGRMVDIVLDIRRGSPHFGQAVLFDMPADPDQDHAEWIWVPPGFAHGNFFTEDSRVEYFCTGRHNAATEGCISITAPDIDWTLADAGLHRLFERHASGEVLMSPKDRLGLSVQAWHDDARSTNFVYGEL
jgi:dTDP-4-dehydrorhamnose 3,5-epimerase